AVVDAAKKEICWHTISWLFMHKQETFEKSSRALVEVRTHIHTYSWTHTHKHTHTQTDVGFEEVSKVRDDTVGRGRRKDTYTYTYTHTHAHTHTRTPKGLRDPT